MSHISIANLDYETAMKVIQEAHPDLSSLDIEIDFGVDHSQSKIIRDFIAKIFEAHKISPPWKGRFVLITDELINNAIEHGSSVWDLDTCIIQAGRREDGSFSIALEVHDTGTGKDSDKGKNMLRVKEDHTHDTKTGWVYMKKRGRWLFHITEKLVDRLEFTESPKGWLAVKIEKNIPKTLF
jgi:anti-sigma regulatory factor (Ser/Thr protein kinase)